MPQIHALPADRQVDVRRVAGKEHASFTVALEFPRGVAEAGSGAQLAQIGLRAIHRLQRFADLGRGDRFLAEIAPAAAILPNMKRYSSPSIGVRTLETPQRT